jgi:putative inorganic carbon (HCO3(-)) transporter
MSEIKKPSLNLVDRWQFVLIALTILFAIITGASFFLIPSSYAPLFVLAGTVTVIAFFTWLKKPVWALYFSIFIILLPTGLIPSQVNSYINRAATVIALTVWVIDVIRRRSRILINASTLVMLLFTVWAAMTLLWAEYFSEGISILQSYVLRLILFLVLIVNEIKTKKTLEGLMNTLALSGWVLVIVSFVTVILKGYTPGTRLQVLDVNENGLGISLLITLSGVLWRAIHPTKHRGALNKWLAAIFLILSIGLIGLSGSRGSAISLVITLVAFLIWKPTRSWGILGLIIIGLAILIAPIFFSTTIERFLGGPGETILGGRETIWPVGWQLINSHPLLGVGIGNSFFQVVPFLLAPASLHNPILVIWAETGFIGLLLYLGVLISAIISFVNQYLRSIRIDDQYLLPYYALIASVFLGYMASWIKGGGMESDFSYFLMVALLIIPSSLKQQSLD